MNAVISCPCKQNDLNKNSPPCQFVQIFDKLPECPCSCIPSINAGPPCPFKSPAPCKPSAVQCILQADRNPSGSLGCPLSSGIGNTSPNSPFSDQSQLCVFAEANPINFKELPQHQCTCVPGTCPEIAKNLIRSWGFDPMCFCPCPTPAAIAIAAATSKIASDGVITAEKSKSLQKISKTNIKAASGRNASGINLSGVKDNMSPGDNVTAGVEGSPTAPVRATSKLAVSVTKRSGVEEDDQNDCPPGGKLNTRGKGFKIYEIDGEKVLFNYSTKNCKWLKCECSKKQQSCGCDEWIRMTKYKNCCCPGAKKRRPVPAKTVVKDHKTSQDHEQQGVALDEQKSVKYDPRSKRGSDRNIEVPKELK